MNVSILMTTCNKNDCLPNTLHSIIRQKISFPLTVCIVDDCSDINPESIIREFIPNVIFERQNSKVGFNRAYCHCFNKLIPKDTDVIILQSSDVIHASENTIEELVSNTGEKTISLAEVVDIDINPNMHKTFNNSITPILNNWNSYIKRETQLINNIPHKRIWTKYSGKGHPSYLFFLGAARKKDLDLINYGENSCDSVLNDEMKNLNFIPRYPNVRGIHQRHEKFVYECALINTCTHNCIRKQKRI
jgi:glycosyltransferase involved in cell wall biosynthesis